jgi:hypothetical protein
VEKNVPFWIDTLCVPIKPYALWLCAMNRLRRPYQTAKYVLVLDSYLCTQDSTKLSPMEIWARVLCCSWSRRLWTFQEGRLSQDLLFQFADQAISMEDVWTDLPSDLSCASLRNDLVLAYRSTNVIRNIAKRLPESSTKKVNFRPKPDVWDMRESLQARSVSVIYDEALCLFCNMGFDMSLITDVPIEERMPTFWAHVPDIPLGLIFSTARQKLTRPGLHWAPASFMGDIDTAHWYLEQSLEPRVDGHPTPAGLEIQVPAFMLSPDFLKHDDSFDIIFSKAWVTIQDSDRAGTWYFIEMLPGYWNQSRTSDPKAGAQLILLLHDNIKSADEEMENLDPFHHSTGTYGVIGVVTGEPEDDNPPKIEIYRHARLHRYSKALQRYNSMVQLGVERYVMECLGYTVEAKTDEEGRFYESFTPPAKEGEESLDNFEMTGERRDEAEMYCAAFAEENPFARNIAMMVGRNEGKTPEETFVHFGKMARFFLQMRKRSKAFRLSQEQLWVID